MQDFEKLGVFYLGRPYDLASKKGTPGWFVYDSKDLVTHAVCVGMTGSGKTGLCVTLLEEAAMDGIPALIIDPKGDLSNLLLTFPDLRAEDFLPWINREEALKKRMSPEQFAQQQATTWEKGLREWGQDSDRIRRLRAAADFVIYTPGSMSGMPISILKSFAVPPPALVEDTELLNERISTTATSLLTLVGIEADPLQGREHILLANLLDLAWRQGHDLDLAQLIQQIQTPPLSRIGVVDVESFFPSKDRFALAMRFNNLLGAPGFSVWLKGQSLDIDQLLYTPSGKPRMAIFSIAHLTEAERMFFVTLLLSQTVAWMRTQSGTTSLRALLYMDEVFGYFPPVKNPPSKLPLLTMLKQARAYGLGVVLATQNPVDLDYKGLGNAGTWFIGRLQTERDRARVLDGLEGAVSASGKGFDRQRMEQVLSGLGNRVFLMNNVHDDAPEIFETRWAMSYLRGPLTRNQIKSLMDAYKRREAVCGEGPTGEDVRTKAVREGSGPTVSQHPVLPPDVTQYFVPVRHAKPEGATLVYRPMLLAAGDVHFFQSKIGLHVVKKVTALLPMSEGAISVDWEDAVLTKLDAADLEQHPSEIGQFGVLPGLATKAKAYAVWEKEFQAWLYRNSVLNLWRCPLLKVTSTPEETERDFRIRLQQAAHEKRDHEIEQLRKKFAPKMKILTERIRRAEQAVTREAEQARQQKIQTAISFGATLLSAFLGRKAVSASSVGRATTAVRGIGRSIQEAKDVARATETVGALQQQLADLETQFQKEADALAGKWDLERASLETLTVRPKKSDITTGLVTLAWVPYWQTESGQVAAAWE